MNPIQMVKSLLNNKQLQSSSALSIRPGQIMYGKVEKLFPNNMALVKLGTVKLHAQIEAAVKANERYWFEAHPSKNGNLYLKLLDHRIMNQVGRKETISSLLAGFHLPETKSNAQLLQFLLSKELAFTKDQLVKGALWLSETTKPTFGLPALEMMLKKDLPFTSQTFKSLVAFLHPSSFSSQLKELANALDHPKFTSSSDTVILLKDIITNILDGNKLLNGQKAVTFIIDQWHSQQGSKQTQEAAFRLLQDLNVFPKSYSQERAILSLEKGDSQLWQDSKFAKNDWTHNAHEMVKSLNNTQINNILIRLSELAQHLSSNTSKEEVELLKQISNQVNSSLQDSFDVKQLFKQMIQLIGLEHEKEVVAFLKNGIETPGKLESLKALLLTVMSELGANGSKELEPILHRLTGIQLLAHESNGPLQQLYIQFPLSLGNKLSDVILQWSGRKKENGQIDPSFCRILFYIDLENINETVIDMQVQNRVINIMIINDTKGLEVSVTQEQSQSQLKEQLGALNYILSSVKVTSPFEQETKVQPIEIALQQSYRGVDIKI
jgi:hypothetical protein